MLKFSINKKLLFCIMNILNYNYETALKEIEFSEDINYYNMYNTIYGTYVPYIVL